MNKQEYIETYSVHPYFVNHRFDLEVIWDLYHSMVQPYLSVITDFRLHNKSITEEELSIALNVRLEFFKAMKKTFEELKYALNAGKSVMKLKSQIDLQKGINATEYRNPKMIEMQGLRYDDEWKTKTDKKEVELPKTVEILIRTEKLSDEERLEKAQVKEE